MAIEEIVGNYVVFISDKLFKFERSHFKHWKQKILFLNPKKGCQHLTKDILVAPPGSTEQTNKKNM